MKDRPILFASAMVRAILSGEKSQTRRVVKQQPPADALAPICENGWWMWQRFTPDRRHYDGKTVDRLLDQRCPYGVPGDRLWVRESFSQSARGRVIYRASEDEWRQVMKDEGGWVSFPRWTPSIHMPRWASRITLEVTGVRVERLQDISEEDAVAEGVERRVTGDGWREYGLDEATELAGTPAVATARESFRSLWNSINLPPNPVQERVDGKLVTVAYASYPWSAEDFDAAYPGVRAAGVYRGKPITVTPNPWAWVISFKRLPNDLTAD